MTHAALPLTGERTVPGIARENYWFRRHEVVYRWIAEQGFARGTLIEAGCGEGYGADLLRTAGAQVVAIDYDDTVVDHVRRHYPRVQPLRANLVDLPLRSATADVAVSLQVVEHLWDLPTFWAEVLRVLRPGGRAIISTPNRVTFSPGVGRGEKPTNPFHVEEFDADQLLEMLVEAGFTEVRVLGLRHGPRLADTDIVARQVTAILADDWPADLDDLVASVTVTDFAIDAVEPDTDLDLIVVARR
ncbi:MAG: methyltransferase domain-containing protein [Candidatus Nanopelagicales bacterium]